MPQAARLTDPIGHAPTRSSMLAGAVIGGVAAAIGVAVLAGTGGLAAPALVGTAAALGAGISGGAGLGEGLSGTSFVPRDTTGSIVADGSPDVLVNGLPLARAHPDVAECSRHGPEPPVIATGSESVLVNFMPAARAGDTLSCSAEITSGSPDVLIGGGPAQTDVILPDDAVPGWVHGTLAGVGVGSAVVLAGPVVATAGIVGGALGGSAGNSLGGAVFGERSDGQRWAMLAGALLGGWAGGRHALGRTRAHRPEVPAREVPRRYMRCRRWIGEPVDLVTGEVVVHQLDFTLRGCIPLEWWRRYASGSERRGLCGVGWETPADARLELAEDGSAAFRDGNPGAALFRSLPSHAPVREHTAGATLSRELDRLVVTRLDGRRFVFRLPGPGERELRVERIEDASGNWLELVREGDDLCEVIERSGRRLVAACEDGLLRELRLAPADGSESRLLVRYLHDRHGDLVAARDPDGHGYRFAYQDHRLVRHTSPLGHSFHYVYDAYTETGRCVHTWGDGGLLDCHIEYPSAPRQTRYTDSLGHVFTSELDDAGYVRAEVDPEGGRTTYAYDEAGRTVERTDPGGNVHAWTYDDAGNLVEEITPDGAVHAYTYDRMGRLTAYTDPTGHTFTQRLNARGLLVERTQPDGATWRIAHDDRGLPRAITDPLGRTERYEHDACGNLIGLRSPTGAHTRFTHDLAGNVLEIVDPEGALTRLEYDACDRLIQATLPSGAREEVTYDTAGRVVKRRDPTGAVTRFAYTPLGDLASRTDPDGSVVRARHDTEGRVRSVIDRAGRRYRQVRDALGRVVEETDYWGATQELRYDAAGHLIARVDELGFETRLRRDAAGRLLELAAPDRRETFAYDAAGRLLRAESADARLTRSYDALGRVVREDQPHGHVEYRYDAAGHLIERRSSLGHRVRYAFDPDGEVSEIQIDDHRSVRIERDATGRPVRETLNGILTRRFHYDADGRITHHELHEHGILLRSRSYTYDAAGRRTAWSDSRGRGVTLHYDALDRVSSFRVPGLPAAEPVPPLEERAGGGALGAGDPVDRVCKRRGTAFGFDPAGRLVSRTRTDGTHLALEWGSDDRLLRTVPDRGPATGYRYDPLGRRLSKTTGGHSTCFLWDDRALLAEQTPDGTHREYVFYPGTFVPLAWVDSGGSVCFYDSDPIGLPHEVVNARGDTLWRAEYDGAGRRIAEPVRRVAQPLCLQGQYHDPETGLAYTLHRYYDPVFLPFPELTPPEAS